MKIIRVRNVREENLIKEYPALASLHGFEVKTVKKVAIDALKGRALDKYLQEDPSHTEKDLIDAFEYIYKVNNLNDIRKLSVAVKRCRLIVDFFYGEDPEIIIYDDYMD